jgi:hypothetical protein
MLPAGTSPRLRLERLTQWACNRGVVLCSSHSLMDALPDEAFVGGGKGRLPGGVAPVRELRSEKFVGKVVKRREWSLLRPPPAA